MDELNPSSRPEELEALPQYAWETPLDIRLSDYLESLTDRNWHTLRQLIELERNTLTEADARDAHSVYLTALAKARHLQDRNHAERKTA
jgi:hypothetical protein